jgi:hypothetical protein
MTTHAFLLLAAARASREEFPQHIMRLEEIVLTIQREIFGSE